MGVASPFYVRVRTRVMCVPGDLESPLGPLRILRRSLEDIEPPPWESSAGLEDIEPPPGNLQPFP